MPAGHVLRDGRQPQPVGRRAHPRPDQGVEHRRPRLRAHLAARPPRLPVDSRRASGVRTTRRRWRPCGRRGRSRRASTPISSMARRWRTSCTSQANARTLEAVEQADEARGPVGVVHVARRRRPACASRSAWRSADELERRCAWCCARGAPAVPSSAQVRERGEPPRAQPQPVGRARPRRATAEHRFGRRRGRRGRARARSRCPARRRGRRGGARDSSASCRAVDCGDPPARRRPSRATASCTSTTSPSALRRASDSRPAAPSSRPRRKARSVFSGASARAPRWANVTGLTDSRSAGSAQVTRRHADPQA